MERLRKQLQLLAPAASPGLFVDFEELLAADGVRLTGIPSFVTAPAPAAARARTHDASRS